VATMIDAAALLALAIVYAVAVTAIVMVIYR
jgi:hypothetical protein